MRRRAVPHLDAALGVSYPDDAQVQPSLAAQAMLARARHLGAQLRITAVTAGIVDCDKVRGVLTTGGRIDADAVVNCAGPWAAEAAALFGSVLDIRRGAARFL